MSENTFYCCICATDHDNSCKKVLSCHGKHAVCQETFTRLMTSNINSCPMCRQKLPELSVNNYFLTYRHISWRITRNTEQYNIKLNNQGYMNIADRLVNRNFNSHVERMAILDATIEDYLTSVDLL